MADEITVEVLGPEDEARLLAVPEGLFDEPMDPKQTHAFLNDPLHEIAVAFAGDLAVSFASGTVLFHPDKPPSMFINEVGTRPDWTRKGLASKVTWRLVQVARARGCEGIWLGTEPDNTAAIGLYRSLSAVEVEGVYFGWDDAF